MKNESKKPSFRIKKIESLIQKDLGEVIKPFLEVQKGLVTISRVEVSPDMKWAKVHVSIFGGNDDLVLNLLEKNIYAIQGEINRRMPTKIVPRLTFKLDLDPRYAERINQVIKKIHSDD